VSGEADEAHGQVGPTLGGPDIRDITHPRLVRTCRREVALQQVWRNRLVVVRIGGATKARAWTSSQAVFPHQTSDALPAWRTSAARLRLAHAAFDEILDSAAPTAAGLRSLMRRRSVGPFQPR
jgi:hypothetical protein